MTPAAGQSGDVTATGGGPVPSREELTLAWGDRILPALRPAIKVYVASGRFLASTERGAVFAVPDRGLLSRAMGGVADIESALAAHFGTKVSLELVLDEGADPVRADGPGASAGPAAPPGAGPGAGGPPSAAAGPAGDSPGREVTGPPEDGGLGGADPSGSEDRYGDGPEDFDLSDLEDAPGAVLSPEQRLLEAFPGAEEVQQ